MSRYSVIWLARLFTDCPVTPRIVATCDAARESRYHYLFEVPAVYFVNC